MKKQIMCGVIGEVLGTNSPSHGLVEVESPNYEQDGTRRKL